MLVLAPAAAAAADDRAVLLTPSEAAPGGAVRIAADGCPGTAVARSDAFAADAELTAAPGRTARPVRHGSGPTRRPAPSPCVSPATGALTPGPS
ncbi:hypothetical protein ACFQ60_20245 [Streptomyces zhihengii]